MCVWCGSQSTVSAAFRILRATCFGKGDKQIVDYLIAHGASQSIFSAVATGETAIIRELAAGSRARLDRQMERPGHQWWPDPDMTPLQWATAENKIAAIRACGDFTETTKFSEDHEGRSQRIHEVFFVMGPWPFL